jgi:hypothetical protein
VIVAVPKKLYKYQRYNVQTLENLKKQCLWFSRPLRFNDPFDCAITYLVERATEDDWRRVYAHFRQMWLEEKDQRKRASLAEYFSDEQVTDGVRGLLAPGLVKHLRRGLEGEFEKTGVACFSELVDDIVMWSHYSDGHKGFCLEFDTRFKPLDSAVPVRYAEGFPEFHWHDDPRVDLASAIAATKAKGWSYEKEWRVVQERGDVEVSYPQDALTGIYFGCAMSKVDREILESLLPSGKTRKFQMVRGEKAFKLEIVEVSQFLMR